MDPQTDTVQVDAFGTLVCGVDRSPQSLVAARQAVTLGEEDATCWAVAACDTSLAFQAGIHMAEVSRDLLKASRTALDQASAELPGVRPILVQGREVAALLAAASNLEADLVSVGASGMSRGAGILFGSVATAMAHHAPCSVLIARDADRFPGVVLHADDGSRESLEAAAHASRIAARYDSTLVTLRVGEDGSGAEEVSEIAARHGLRPVLRVEQGSPARRIVEVADEVGAGLIAMGSRGRTGLAALGSVSERVTHRAGCSVLVVRRPAHPVFDDSTAR